MKTIEMILSQPSVQALGWALLHFIWQGAIVALLLAGVSWLLRKRSANARYLAACAAMLIMLILPAITIAILYAPPSQPITAEAMLSTAASVEVQATAAPIISSADPSDVSPAAATSLSWQQQVYERMEPLLPWLITVWLMGVLMLSTRLLGGWATAQYLKKRRTRAVAERWQEKLSIICKQLGIAQTVRLLESRWVQVPTVIGWLRPVILLPASALTGLAPHQLEAILAHELAHIRRHDYLINLIQAVIETLLFYHPAVWWVSHRIRAERENCCDDVAVALCGDAITYARALTELEHLRNVQPQLAVAATGGSLVSRIRRLVGAPSPHSNRFAGLLAGAIVILIVVTVGAGAQMSLAPQSNDSATKAGASVQRKKSDDSSAKIAGQEVINEQIDPQIAQTSDDATAEIAQDVSTDMEPVIADHLKQDQENDADQDQQASEQVSDAQRQEIKNRIVEAFIVALKDEDAGVRQQAASSLGSSRDLRAVDPLMAAAKDENAHVRQQAISSLADLRDKRAVDVAMAALKDTSPHVRQAAASALGDFRDGRAVDALLAALKDENTHVRQAAAAALGDLRDRRAVDALIAALKDENEHVRQQAAAALGDLGDPKSVMPLIAAVKDMNAHVRSQAIAALGDLGDSRAVDALIAALKDENAFVRKAAAAALADIR